MEEQEKAVEKVASEKPCEAATSGTPTASWKQAAKEWLKESRDLISAVTKNGFGYSNELIELCKRYIIVLHSFSIGIVTFVGVVLLINGVCLALRGDDRAPETFVGLLLACLALVYLYHVPIRGARMENKALLLLHLVVVSFTVGHFFLPTFYKMQRLHQFVLDYRVYMYLTCVRMILGVVEVVCVCKILTKSIQLSHSSEKLPF